MADDDRHGLEGDTGRKPLPRPDREFEELEDSFSEPGSAFFEEYAEQYAEPEPVRPEPEDFGFDDIAVDDEPAAGTARSRSARSRGVRGGRGRGGSGGGGGGRARLSRGGGGGRGRRPRASAAPGLSMSNPAVRIGLGVLFVVLLILVLALVIRDCRHDALVDSYKQYVNGAAQVSEESAGEGEKLLTIMQNKKGQNAADLQKQVRALGNQAEQLRDRGKSLDSPGKLNDADVALNLSLQYRVNGLRELEKNLPAIIQQSDERLAAKTIKTSMQKFLASDVLMRDSFSAPTSAALRDEGISNVAPPDDQAISFLKGANDIYASDAGARQLVTPLRRRGSQGSSGSSGQNGGNLRGTRLVSVVAVPSNSPVTTSGVSIAASSDLGWRVTVLNGGDFVETNVKVTVTLTYPSSTTPADTQEATIQSIEPDKEAVLSIKGPPSDALQLGQRGTLRVAVAPVQGEQNISNNSADYPVTITFG